MQRVLMRVRGATLLVVAISMVIACAPGSLPGLRGSQPGGPIRVGMLVVTTGVLAAAGNDMMNGWKLYWKNRGTNQWAGRDVITFTEDTGSDPSLALTKARQLVEQNQVNMIIGPMVASEGYAVADYMKTTNVPEFNPIVAADDLTQRQRVKNVIRVAGWASSQAGHPYGEWAAEQGCNGQPCRKILTLCLDYAFGYEVCGGFVHGFVNKGGEIVGQLWAPFTTIDYSAYLAQVPGYSADAVFALTNGTQFHQQWSQFGFKDKLTLLSAPTSLDQYSLRALGPEAEGLVSAGHYAEGRPDKATQDFVDAYLKEYGVLPSYYAAGAYTAGGWIEQAVDKVGGRVEDTDAFLDAVRAVQLPDSPFGPMKLDQYDNPILNIYIRRVERRQDGKLWNVPFKTYPEVSQFWTFDPAEYLKKPVYSRDYQGLPGQ
jgi:branched-chain amino acid transport system substrate-binding protein